MTTKPLAKSLHTVTVLVRVARHVIEQQTIGDATPAEAVLYAAALLGLADAPDVYGLKAAAVKQLAKGA